MTTTELYVDSDYSGTDLPPFIAAAANIDAGTILALDLTRPDCVGSASGLITVNSPLIDLAGVHTGALIEGDKTNDPTLSASGLSWPAIPGGTIINTGGVMVPLPDLPLNETLFLSLWLKLTTAPSQPYRKFGGIGPAAVRNANANEATVNVDSGNAASIGIRSSVLLGGAGTGAGITVPGIVADTVVNFSACWAPGQGLTEYVNGAHVRTAASAALSLVGVVSPTLLAQIPVGGTLYAVTLGLPGRAGKTPAEQAAFEFAGLNGAFT